MKRIGLLLLLVVLAAGSVLAKDEEFHFLAIGDMPYSTGEYTKYLRLLKQSESENFAFLMHVGDIKEGGSACTDASFEDISQTFRTYPKPVAYTPGDNEWTDCHTTGGDPIERLQKLRELFFKNPEILRLDQLNAEHQSQNPEFETYVENYRFVKSNVLFIVTHIVGSGNNRRSGHPPSMEEFSRRNQANIAFLKESFNQAIAKSVSGVAVVIHANPNFERGKVAGFKDFLDIMRWFLTEYRNPVICIHGDSHTYRIDRPLRNDNGLPYLNFTRMEVFGSPNIAGVVITVNPSKTQVFQYQPYYLDEKIARLVGDVNEDGTVNIFDLVIVAGQFGKVGADLTGNVNGDRLVNIFDLLAVAENFGKSLVAAPSMAAKIELTTDQKHHIASAIDQLESNSNRSNAEEIALNVLKAILPERLPTQTQLLANYPNPFNPETWIPFQLAQDSTVTAKIHDLTGRQIRTIELGHIPAGNYVESSKAIYWDGKTDTGEQVSSGTYFYQIQAGDYIDTRKMVILK